MGRVRVKKNRAQINVRVTPEQLAEYQRLADAKKLSLSEWLRQTVVRAVIDEANGKTALERVKERRAGEGR